MASAVDQLKLPHQFHYNQTQTQVDGKKISLTCAEPSQFFKSINAHNFKPEEYIKVVEYYLIANNDKIAFEYKCKKGNVKDPAGLQHFHSCQIALTHSEELLEKIKKILKLPVFSSADPCRELQYPNSAVSYNTPSIAISQSSVQHPHPSLTTFLTHQEIYSLHDLEKLRTTVTADIACFTAFKQEYPIGSPKYSPAAEMGQSEDGLLLPHIEKQLAKKKEMEFEKALERKVSEKHSLETGEEEEPDRRIKRLKTLFGITETVRK